MTFGALSDHEIAAAVEAGEVKVTPFDPAMIRPAALGVRLGMEAWVLRADGPVDVADASTHPALEPRELDGQGRLRVEPGEVVLAPTLERVALASSLVGLIDGTSSYARLGISVVLCHQVSPGYGTGTEDGAILTLEIMSRLAHAVYLRPRMRIGNLMLIRCAPARKPYPQMHANYSSDTFVRASRLAEHAGSIS
jgi:dCTP deaminase